MLVYGMLINLILCFFNLIPIPPLDGSHLLYHALPPRAGAWYRGLNRYGYLLDWRADFSGPDLCRSFSRRPTWA